MKLEIDMPEHHYNNIMSIDSVSLGRVPYKGIIMYTINAIKHGRVLEQEPTTKNDLGVDDCISRQAVLNATVKKSSIWDHITNSEGDNLETIVSKLPSVTPQEPQTFKWCTNCREYDQKKHCCHRWSKVIRDTVEEMKQEPKTGHWINTCEYAYRAIDYVECSCCHHKSLEEGNYCPNCGAKIEGGSRWE